MRKIILFSVFFCLLLSNGPSLSYATYTLGGSESDNFDSMIEVEFRTPFSVFGLNTSLGIGVSNLCRIDDANYPDINSSSFMLYYNPGFNLPVDLNFGGGVFLKKAPSTYYGTPLPDEGGVLPSFSFDVGYKLPCSITAFSGISKNSDPMNVSIVFEYQKSGDLLDSYGFSLKFGA